MLRGVFQYLSVVEMFLGVLKCFERCCNIDRVGAMLRRVSLFTKRCLFDRITNKSVFTSRLKYTKLNDVGYLSGIT